MKKSPKIFEDCDCSFKEIDDRHYSQQARCVIRSLRNSPYYYEACNPDKCTLWQDHLKLEALHKSVNKPGILPMPARMIRTVG